MPRLNTSKQVKQRTRQLLEKLLSFANYELEQSDYFADKLTVRWKNEATATPELVVETELKVLIELAFEREVNSTLKDQVRNDLRVLEEFMKILEDNRARTQGAKGWRFTLKLWDKSTQTNLDQFEKNWDQIKKQRSKRSSNADISHHSDDSEHESSSDSDPERENDENYDQNYSLQADLAPEACFPAVPLISLPPTLAEQTIVSPAACPKVRCSYLPTQQNINYTVNQEQLKELLKLLSFEQSARLITLEGIGGVGKTTLAIEAAQRCLAASQSPSQDLEAPTFEAIIFTSAQTQHLTGPDLSQRLTHQHNLQDIFRNIVRTLDRLAPWPPDFSEQLEFIRECLGQQTTLLIVDNLETLEDKEAVLSFLSEIPNTVKVIVTSRVRLGLGARIPLESLAMEEGIKLIQQQAEAQSLSLTPSQLTHIYQQTDGLPLAIIYTLGMIAAYGTRPEEIDIAHLARPDGNFAKHCFEASVSRLRGQDAHSLLMAFSLFQHPALPEALAHIAFPSLYTRADRKPFTELYQLSLIEFQLGKYSMHSLTREYARSELKNHPGFEHEARARWVEWYLDFLQRHGEDNWYDWHPVSPIEKEWNNLCGVMEWLRDQGAYSVFTEFWEQLKGYTRTYGHWDERLTWLKWLMTEATRQGAHDILADAMYHYSQTLYFFNHPEKTQEAIHLSQRIWEVANPDNIPLLIDTAMMQAQLYVQIQDYEQAHFWAGRGQSLLEKATSLNKYSAYRVVKVPYCTAEIFLKQGDLEKAKALYQEAFKQAETTNCKRLKSYSQGYLASIAIQQGQYQEAEILLNKVIADAQKSNDNRCLAFCYKDLAELEQKRGNDTKAISWAQQAKHYFTHLNMRQEINAMENLIASLRS